MSTVMFNVNSSDVPYYRSEAHGAEFHVLQQSKLNSVTPEYITLLKGRTFIAYHCLLFTIIHLIILIFLLSILAWLTYALLLL